MFHSLLRRIRNLGRHQTPPNSVNIRRLSKTIPSLGWTTYDREEILWLALQYIVFNRVRGSYAEFGVWRGDTFATAFHFAEKLSQETSLFEFDEMKFFALDSFEGFPDPKGDDIYPQFQAGGRSFDFPQFTARLSQRGLTSTQVSTIKGWFSETLHPQTGPASGLIMDGSLAIAYVDCDLYESTKDVLPFLKRKLSAGGVLIFDDWYCFAGHPLKGEQKACREFLLENPEVVLIPFHPFGWHGNSFIYHTLDADQVKSLGRQLTPAGHTQWMAKDEKRK